LQLQGIFVMYNFVICVKNAGKRLYARQPESLTDETPKLIVVYKRIVKSEIAKVLILLPNEFEWQKSGVSYVGM